jgi:hypothetical protein
MKKLVIILIVLISLLMGNILKAQNLGIGPDTFDPDPSAGVEMRFTNKGLLIPRVALTSTSSPSPITSPANSLLVYNTATTGDVTPGYYYWTGSKWMRLLAIDDKPAWLLTGNAGTTPGTNFIGTTDAKDVVFKTNNAEIMRITSGGYVGIATTTPSSKLHVINTKTSSDEGAIRGIQNNTDYWGIGGKFEGGYKGIDVYNYPSGSNIYYGVYSTVSGGSGSNYGIRSSAYNGATNFGVYGSISSSVGYGIYGYANNTDGYAVFGVNDDTTGTSIVGLGNGLGTFYLLTDGSGGAFTSDNIGVYGRGVNGGAGVYGEDGTRFGYIADGSNWAVYGDDGTGKAGALGGSSWAGYFWDNVNIGTSTGNVHRWWGILRAGSTSDLHEITPNAANWSYVGTSSLYFYYMYSNNFIDPSRRELKRSIIPVENDLMNYVINDIDKIQPYFYKYNEETDVMEKGNEPKYRPNMHLGVILDESPDYIQDNAFSGIDIYALATLGIVGVKYNREEIKDLKQKIETCTKTINDFGSVSSKSKEIWVDFSSEFKNKLSDTPVVIVTSNIEGVNMYVTEKSKNGFKVVCEKNVDKMTFDWIAYAKINIIDDQSNDIEIPPELLEQLDVPDHKKEAIKTYFEQNSEKEDLEEPTIYPKKSRKLDKPNEKTDKKQNINSYEETNN